MTDRQTHKGNKRQVDHELPTNSQDTSLLYDKTNNKHCKQEEEHINTGPRRPLSFHHLHRSKFPVFDQSGMQ